MMPISPESDSSKNPSPAPLSVSPHSSANAEKFAKSIPLTGLPRDTFLAPWRTFSALSRVSKILLICAVARLGAMVCKEYQFRHPAKREETVITLTKEDIEQMKIDRINEDKIRMLKK